MKKIFICGDSTAASYDPTQTLMVGWGQLLGSFMPEDVFIRNHAMAGRSTKTFLAEGRLDRILPELSPGDLLLVQFAHNDEGDKPERHTEPFGDYAENLRIFIRTARSCGALPVLMTPICIRNFRDGTLLPSHDAYLEAMRTVAGETRVPLIDLYDFSFRLVQSLGDEGSKALYMHVAEGESPLYPEAVRDDTHTRRPGAEAYARFVAGELLKI